MLAASLIAVLALGAQGDCHAEEDGQPFAVCFDPWTGLELGGGGGAQGDGAAPLLVAGLRFRGERDSRSKAASTWLLAQRALATELKTVDGQWALTATAYEGVYRRHVAEGVVLLPTTPPIELPFPLDVGLAGSAGRYERRGADGTGWALEALRLSALFDPIASASGRFHLAFGPTAAYRVRSDGAQLAHDVTPLTGVLLFFNFESEDGLWVLRGTGVGAWTFSPSAPGVLTLRARGEVEGARVLAAVNDQPLSLFVRATGAWNDAGARAGSEWAVTGGLLLRLWSAR